MSPPCLSLSQAKAAAFVAAMADDSEDEEEAAGTGSPSPHASLPSASPTAPPQKKTDDSLECIICRECNDSPLGLLALALPARTLVSVGGERVCGVAVTSCGHALHQACYDHYFASLLQQV